jgi:hypothetical protein
MFSKLFRFLFCARPKFSPGQLLFISTENLLFHHSSPMSPMKYQYLLIERRRWERGAQSDGWVYEGTIFHVENNQLAHLLSGACYAEGSFWESNLMPINYPC